MFSALFKNFVFSIDAMMLIIVIGIFCCQVFSLLFFFKKKKKKKKISLAIIFLFCEINNTAFNSYNVNNIMKRIVRPPKKKKKKLPP
jgi:D-alanyl-lipoteichoic acid acyltransferase DltB (MBOAT superfamily)